MASTLQEVGTGSSYEDGCLVYVYEGIYLYVVDNDKSPSKLAKLAFLTDVVQVGDYLRTISTCNGLLCYAYSSERSRSIRKRRSFIICNPTTRSFKQIRCPSQLNESGIWDYDAYDLSYGFGYDSQHDDYKIVVTRTGVRRDVIVYSLKGDWWWWRPTHVAQPEQSSSIQCDEDYYNDNNNDMLYYSAENRRLGQERIARFDLRSQEWKDELEIESYPRVDEQRWTNRVVRSGDGSMFFEVTYNSGEGDVCVMNNSEVENQITLTKVFGISVGNSMAWGPITRSRKQPHAFCTKYFVGVGKDWFGLINKKVQPKNSPFNSCERKQR